MKKDEAFIDYKVRLRETEFPWNLKSLRLKQRHESWFYSLGLKSEFVMPAFSVPDAEPAGWTN